MMEKQPVGVDVLAAIAAGVLGLVVLSAIWVGLVFPGPVASGGGGILTGTFGLTEHEWGFDGFAKGGPEICAGIGNTTTIALRNDGKNLHGFQVVDAQGNKVAGLNSTDLLRPGTVRQITIKLDKAGSYFYICPVPGHRAKGMVAPFVCQSGPCAAA